MTATQRTLDFGSKGGSAKNSSKSSQKSSSVSQNLDSPVSEIINKKNARVQALAEEILHHQHLYYNAHAEITDAAFDALLEELEVLDPLNPVLTLIGADDSTVFDKVTHVMPMMPQDLA